MFAIRRCLKRSSTKKDQPDAATIISPFGSLFLFDSQFPNVSLAMMNGDRVELDPPIAGSDRVEQIRQRVAAARGLYDGQIRLMHGEVGELHDGVTMAKALKALSGYSDLTLAVVLGPCRARPSEYESHINRDAIGVLEVDRIKFEFGHRLIYPDEEGYSWHQRIRNALGYEKGRLQPAARLPAGPVPAMQPTQPFVFPEPQGININMMPFIMGQRDSVPAEYQHYWPLIEKCNIPREESGKVGYLTIHESLVKEGESQRRSGLHIESPGRVQQGGVYDQNRIDWGCGIVRMDLSKVQGGIYMASNVPNSCRVWNVQISDPAAVVGHLGDIEHLRDVLGEGITMEAGKMYWLTDSTPHESLPLATETHRQFFRVVAGSLSAWYPAHSTANPLVVPDSKVTKIVDGNKFDEDTSKNS
jgi:hypothetical protein